MKALLLVSELEDYTISYANGVARHISVIVGVPHRNYARLASWFDPSVDLRLLDWPRHSSLTNPNFLLALTKLIRQERPDLIHLLSNSTLWLNFAAPFWRPIPLVTTVHDIDVHPGDTETRRVPRWASRLIARQSTDLIVHGEGLRRLAIDRFEKPPGHVHVLSHPSIQRYAYLARHAGIKRKASRDCLTVLLFGRIFAYKGLELLIRAEAALGDRIANLRVVVAGRGDNAWQFRHLMGNPAQYIVHNRFLGDCEVAQLFVDAVVLPYCEASQSGVMNLAASFGKPVIVTDVGELGETVAPRRMGLVIPPSDAQALADAIHELASNSHLRSELGANALRWANGPNAPETVGASAAKLYDRIVGMAA